MDLGIWVNRIYSYILKVFGVDFDSSRSLTVTPRILISANHLLERSQHSVAVSHPFF
jgi:hypothetical protein